MHRTALVAASAAFAGCLMGLWMGGRLERNAEAQGEEVAALMRLTPEERINVRVHQQAKRSVVNITTSTAPRESLFLFEPPEQGAGSGWVYDTKGRILTNYHVVAGADSIWVTFHDGERAEAGVIGFDAVNDIAVLEVKVDARRLHPVQLGSSDNLLVGQRVYAFGNPFGWDGTMSTGIISSLNRTLPSRRHRTMKSIIQIDGSLNKGNSGGPLLDSSGRLIGMNVAIASQSGDSAGIGFAIPVNTLKRILPQLLDHGRVVRPTIGIAAVAPRAEGLEIAQLTPDGPAERAGLRGYRLVTRTIRRGGFLIEQREIDRDRADVIVAVDGKRVRTLDDFLSLIERRRPGDQVELTVLRQNRPVRVKVQLGREG